MKIHQCFYHVAAYSIITMPLAKADFTNYIRQVQYPSGLEWDVSVAPTGDDLSKLAIDPGGARFELWTVNSDPYTAYLLDSTYVGTYTPVATSYVVSEDNGGDNAIPRTRADRPFQVYITVGGLRSGEDDPEPSKAVQLMRHVQAYGENGTGADVDPDQATMVGKVQLGENGNFLLNYGLSSIPSQDLSKIRGEERYSVYSLEDYQAPASQLTSSTIQIWPVADGQIAGIDPSSKVRYEMPQLTLTLNDLYPASTTYAQVYRGNAELGTTGQVVPGSAIVLNEAVPQDRVLVVDNYDDVIPEDGIWTMELLTETPFGIDRLGYVTFVVDRTMKVRGTFSTIE